MKDDFITVKSLCANTPVARTTFYSYYQNIDELKEEIEDYLIEGIIEVAQKVSGGNIPEMDFTIFFAETMNYIKVHWCEFYAFLIIQPDLRMISKWKMAIKNHFAQRFFAKKQISNYELISESIASAVLGAYIYWLENPESVNIQKLNQIVVAALEQITKIL